MSGGSRSRVGMAAGGGTVGTAVGIGGSGVAVGVGAGGTVGVGDGTVAGGAVAHPANNRVKTRA